MIAFTCPRCRQSLTADDGAVGKLARCPRCGANMAVPPPRRPAQVPARRPEPLVIDQGPSLLADPERATNLPVPLPAEGSPSAPLTISDAEWDGAATRSKAWTFLIAGGLVGSVVVGVLLIVVLAGGGPARKTQPPRPLPPEEGAEEVARRRDPREARGAESPPAPGRKGRPVGAEEEEDTKPRPGKPPIPVPGDETESRKQPPPVEPPASPQQPYGGGTPSAPTSPISSPSEDKPVDDGKESARVQGLIGQLDKSLPTEDRVKALEALGKLGPRAKDKGGRAVAQCMVDPNPKVGREARDALEKIDPVVAKECTAIVRDNDLRLPSIQTLGRLGKEARSATPILIHVIRTVIEKPEVRAQIAKPFEVAAAAIDALVAIAPDYEDLPPRLMRRWMEEAPDERVKIATVRALPKLDWHKTTKDDKHAAVSSLVKELKAATWPTVRAAAADALGDFGPDAKAAADALKVAKGDPNDEVRKKAERALDKIAGGR